MSLNLDPRTRKRRRPRRQKLEQEQNQKTRNWFAFLLSAIGWATQAYFVFTVDPQLVADILLPGLYLPFFLLLSVNLLTTLYLLTSHVRRTAIYTTAIILLLYLMLFDLANTFNTILVLIIIAFLEFLLFSSKNPDPNQTTET